MTTQQIIDSINSDSRGFYMGNRMILPFKCQLIKLIVDSHIYTEFVGSKDIKISQDAQNTSIYFREIGRLSSFEDSYKSIKMIIAGLDEDLTDRRTHTKMICYILDNREIELEVPGEDIIFVE